MRDLSVFVAFAQGRLLQPHVMTDCTTLGMACCVERSITSVGSQAQCMMALMTLVRVPVMNAAGQRCRISVLSQCVGQSGLGSVCGAVYDDV